MQHKDNVRAGDAWYGALLEGFEMHKTVIGLGVALIVSVVGAGCSSSICSYSKACPNDPNLTNDEIKLKEDQCKTLEDQYKNEPCWSEASSYLNCLKSNVACDSVGKTDGTQTQAKQQANCASQLSTAQACCTKNNNAPKICKTG